MKTALILVLAFSNLVLGALLWRAPSTEKIERMQTELAVVQTRQKSNEQKGEDRLATLTKENEVLNAKVKDMQGELSILHAGRSSGPGAKAGLGLPVSRAVLNELLSNPETVRQAMDWIKADLRPRYASLIALQTQLNPAQKEALLDLLAERYATRMDLAATGNAPQTKELRQQLDAEYQSKLEALVGSDGADLFQKSEVKPVTWDRMSRLDQMLRADASPLNKEQYSTLWPVLSNAVFYYSMPQSQAEIDTLMAKRNAGMQEALTKAEGILNQEQLATLTKLLKDDNAKINIEWQTFVKMNEARKAKAASQPTGTP